MNAVPIAGLCGRIWELPDSSSTWVEHKSRTGADILSLQFISAQRGYMNAFAVNEIHQAMTRLNR